MGNRPLITTGIGNLRIGDLKTEVIRRLSVDTDGNDHTVVMIISAGTDENGQTVFEAEEVPLDQFYIPNSYGRLDNRTNPVDFDTDRFDYGFFKIEDLPEKQRFIRLLVPEEPMKQNGRSAAYLKHDKSKRKFGR